ncbi:unnamed protein product [Vitrella brassicaformis CCMP3155]|uniref:HVA22-like protein n=2 Tax=Vitrella brassicaformis TaxID=1169539 RepID=A0A0G4H1X0_VITBC|nr:unnamed protein product [Vitrella brassicaformis CCMP3155]|eukprot:CEM37628.1 unnamed protein product [Vitrella brassicaformis CCMP3155]
MLSVVPFIGLLGVGVQLVWPAACTFQMLVKGEKGETKIVQWTIYWVIYLLYTFVERNLIFFLIPYFPLYSELKVLAFLWLIHPEFQGAAFLWYKFLEKPHKMADEMMVEKLDKTFGSVVNQMISHKRKEDFDKARTDKDE